MVNGQCFLVNQNLVMKSGIFLHKRKAVCRIRFSMTDNPENMRPVRARNLIAAAVMFGGLAAVGYKWALMLNMGLEQVFEGSLDKLAWLVVGLIPLPIVIYVSAKWPAITSQSWISNGVVQDFAYIFLRILVRVSLIAVIWEVFGVLQLKYFPAFAVTFPSSIPVGIRFIAAFLIVDFLFYFDHRIRHRISLFWHFHAVHHAQRELNFFTDARAHIFDRVWSLLILAIPTLILKLNAPQVILIALIIEFHQAMYHANFKSNYGFLRYVLVTPQSHRIHHSRLPEHQNKNFGGSLSIWDHLFGTQHNNYDEYPETGIDDEMFPHENGRNPVRLLDTFGAHFLYPFGAIYRQYMRKV